MTTKAVVVPGLYAVDKECLPIKDYSIGGLAGDRTTWFSTGQGAPGCVYFRVTVGGNDELECELDTKQGAGKFQGEGVAKFKAQASDILQCCTLVEATSVAEGLVVGGVYHVSSGVLEVKEEPYGDLDRWGSYEAGSDQAAYFMVLSVSQGRAKITPYLSKGFFSKHKPSKPRTLTTSVEAIRQFCTLDGGSVAPEKAPPAPEQGLVVGCVYRVSTGSLEVGGDCWAGYSADSDRAAYFVVLSVSNGTATIKPYLMKGWFKDHPPVNPRPSEVSVTKMLRCCKLVSQEGQASSAAPEMESPWEENMVDTLVGLLQGERPKATEEVIRSFILRLRSLAVYLGGVCRSKRAPTTL